MNYVWKVDAGSKVKLKTGLEARGQREFEKLKQIRSKS
jgi:hypothetical protein